MMMKFRSPSHWVQAFVSYRYSGWALFNTSAIPTVVAPAPCSEREDPWLTLPVKIALLLILIIMLFDANYSLFQVLNGFSPILGNGWALITVFGDTLVALAICLPLGRYRPDLAWAAMLAALLATIFVHGLKSPLGLPRPAALLEPESFHVIGKVYWSNAFPSGHATTIATLCGIIILGWGKAMTSAWRITLLAVAILAGLSRVMVGAHWPLDVLGGFIGGWLAAAGGLLWARHWPWGLTAHGRLVIHAALTMCAIALLFNDSNYPVVRSWSFTIAGACLLATFGDSAMLQKGERLMAGCLARFSRSHSA
jgi:membrane-associated phospholipid phosphatase